VLRRWPCWRWSPVRTSSRVAGSDGTDGRWQIARRVAADRVISTVDPDSRHAHKTVSRRQDGFTAHVVVEPDTGLITNTRLTPAAGAANSDAAVGVELLADDDTVTGPVQVLGDSAYGTGAALDALGEAGHTPVIKPWPLRPAVAGGFTLDDFTVDEAAGTATCPHGVTRPISRTRVVTFGVACRGCPLREPATAAFGRVQGSGPPTSRRGCRPGTSAVRAGCAVRCGGRSTRLVPVRP
jgi:hypothetical protein